MKKQSLNALAASYRADLLYYIERAKLGKCPPHWQAYCFGEIAAAKGTDAYPEDGDALLDELHRLVDTVPQITNREESAAEIAAYRGQMLFYFDRDYYTLAELVRLPDRKKYGACVYIDADGSRQDRPGYANDIALQVDEWRRENGIPFDKSTIAASPSVDLPAPFSPTSAVTEERRTAKSALSSATVPGKTIETFSASRMTLWSSVDAGAFIARLRRPA